MDFLNNWQIAESSTPLSFEQEVRFHKLKLLPGSLWHNPRNTHRPMGFPDRDGEEESGSSEEEEDDDDD
jgi:hypothetical protein